MTGRLSRVRKAGVIVMMVLCAGLIARVGAETAVAATCNWGCWRVREGEMTYGYYYFEFLRAVVINYPAPGNGLVPANPRANRYKTGEGTPVCPPGQTNPGYAEVTPTAPNWTDTTTTDECTSSSIP